ncbi:MAG: hypothetical protein QOD31_530, partial [Pseudonocardiales bacterium]|nr:hypothetical protein [Pseudonocardiales bacterium]
ASALITGADVKARTVVATPTAVAQRLNDQSVLVTVLAEDTARAKAELQQLCAEVTQTR